VQKIEQPNFGKAVIDVPAIPPGAQPPGLAERHQVLRNGGLAQPENGFDVADAGFTRSDDQQDLITRRLTELREKQR
jgi:hypothetical protein